MSKKRRFTGGRSAFVGRDAVRTVIQTGDYNKGSLQVSPGNPEKSAQLAALRESLRHITSADSKRVESALDDRRVSTTLRHWPDEFSVAPDLSPASRPAAWAG
jgi:hypothetical protein